MTLETLYMAIAAHPMPIVLVMLASPALTYLLCYFIPGRQEEPWLLSFNLGLSVISLLLLTGYLAYATNTGGWKQVIQQANVLLLLLPLLHLMLSLWLAKHRLPLEDIPAFRTLQGLAMMAGVYLVLSWLASRIYIIFFAFIPFHTFLGILAVLLAIAYLGFRRAFG